MAGEEAETTQEVSSPEASRKKIKDATKDTNEVIDELATESHRTLLLDRLESQLKAKPYISRMLFAFNASDDRKVQKAIDQEFADWRKKQENAAEALTGVMVYTQTFALHLLEGPSELIFKALGFFHSISTEVRQVESPAPGVTPRPNEKGEPPGLVSVVRVLHFTELHAVRVARTWCSMPHPGRATGSAQQPLDEGSCHEMVFSLYKKMLCLCLKVRKLLDGEQDNDHGSLLKTYKKAADELPSIDEVLAVLGKSSTEFFFTYPEFEKAFVAPLPLVLHSELLWPIPPALSY